MASASKAHTAARTATGRFVRVRAPVAARRFELDPGPSAFHGPGVLELLIRMLIDGRQPQEELSEAQLETFTERLVKGELSRKAALQLLRRRARMGDLEAVETALSYMAALGYDDATTLKLASEFYLDRRHYGEAHRYAQKLCHEHDRYGPALRLLAVLDTLRGDHASALVHADEYMESRRREDLVLRGYQLEALYRSGATTTAAELAQRLGLRPDLQDFLHRRARGRVFGRFSWRGSPTKSGELFWGHDVHGMQKFFRDMLKAELRNPLPDLASVDRTLNAGTYLPDREQFEHVDVWVSPARFEFTLTGDCEDFALWAWVNLCRQGHKARFVLGGLFHEELNHAWVTIHRGQAIDVLECTPQGYNPPIRAQRAHEYRPMYSVDRNLFWYRH